MTKSATTRGGTGRLLVLACASLLLQTAGAAYAEQGGNYPAPIVRVPQNPIRLTGPNGVPNGRTAGPPRGAHLGQWMQQHGNLSAQQQQRALQSEPGFNQLPPQTQQRMMQRLDHLNSLPEQQRERVISRNEAMERLTPQQRGYVRNAMGQLSALPQDRRRTVARAFRDLRSMPPQERNGLLASPGFRSQFSDQERGTLGNLLSVSPLLPDSR